MGNYHVPFWRAVEGVTPSLTLIIDRWFEDIFVPERSLFGKLYRDSLRSRQTSQESSWDYDETGS